MIIHSLKKPFTNRRTFIRNLKDLTKVPICESLFDKTLKPASEDKAWLSKPRKRLSGSKINLSKANKSQKFDVHIFKELVRFE